MEKGERWRNVDCGCVLIATGNMIDHGSIGVQPECIETACSETPAVKHVCLPPAHHVRESDRITFKASTDPCHVVNFSPPSSGFYGRGIALKWMYTKPTFAPLDVPVSAEFRYGWPKAPVFVNGTDSIVIPKPATCGHPGPHGYGGLCFPCHVGGDILNRLAMKRKDDDAVKPTIEGPFFHPAAQSRSLSAGIGVWQLREERKPEPASAIPEGEGR